MSVARILTSIGADVFKVNLINDRGGADAGMWFISPGKRPAALATPANQLGNFTPQPC